MIERFNNRGEINLEEANSAVEKIESLPENKPIDPMEFIGVEGFDEKDIKRDLQSVEKKKALIGSQRKSTAQFESGDIADFAETIIPEGIRRLGWLGEKVKMIRPSLYDDFYNGIDSVVHLLSDEIVEDEKDIKSIGFTIDFTVSDEQKWKKIKELADRIKAGEIPKIKYFKTSIVTKEGTEEVKIKNFKLPRIIMTCSEEMLNQAENDLLNFENNSNDEILRKKAKNTPLRAHFIKETLNQLESFLKVSQMHKNAEAITIYGNALEAFKEIISDLGIEIKVLK